MKNLGLADKLKEARGELTGMFIILQGLSSFCDYTYIRELYLN